MPTPEKEARVAALKDALAEGNAVYLSDFTAISAAEMNELRGKVIEAGGRIEVVKNRLLKLALADTPGSELVRHLTGPTAVTFCAGDPIGPARAMREFGEGLRHERQRWVIKAAFVEGRPFDGESAVALAQLPPVEAIKGSVVGGLAGPLSSLFYTLNAAVSELVFTLQAVAEKREQEAA